MFSVIWLWSKSSRKHKSTGNRRSSIKASKARYCCFDAGQNTDNEAEVEQTLKLPGVAYLARLSLPEQNKIQLSVQLIVSKTF